MKKRRVLKYLAGIAILVMVFVFAGKAEKAEAANCTLKISGVTYNSISIDVTSDYYYYDGVAIYGSTSKHGKYKYLYSIKSYGYQWHHKNKNLKSGKAYYYKAKVYNYNYDGKKTYYGTSNIVGAKPKLGKAKLKTVKSVSGNKIVLKWGRVEGASGYQIYRSTNRNTGFQLIKEVKNSKRVSYNDKAVSYGTKYFYYVTAVRKTSKRSISANKSITKGTKFLPRTTSKPNIRVLGPTTAVVSWDGIAGADGYMVYRAEGYSNNYVKVKGTKSTKVKIKGLVNGVRYSYKIKVYKKVNGKAIKSAYSKSRSGYMNYYGYADESWSSRYSRITAGGSSYATQGEAAANMTTITINVWDIDSNGNKYTRTMSMPVNKHLAPTIKQAFKEIYEGNEKFPIHSIGCYSWRGDNSTSEHCQGTAIDINPNENCMMDGDTVVVGSYWRPYEDPYSIPTDGEVARILAKYGFTQGLWGYRNDYMHFSYFGG